MSRLWKALVLGPEEMKHSEMIALASLVFFAHIIPKGIALAIAVVLSFLGMYLGIQGN
jgi:hypothetical protein